MYDGFRPAGSYAEVDPPHRSSLPSAATRGQTRTYTAIEAMTVVLGRRWTGGVGALLIKLVTGKFSHGLAQVFTNWAIYGLVFGPLGTYHSPQAKQKAEAGNVRAGD